MMNEAQNVDGAYREMAQDEASEAEALDWAEATIGDADESQEAVFEVVDDSGLIAIVDPDAYVSFVREDWNTGQLEEHFLAQMREHRLLIWGTDMENFWLVQVQFSPTDVRGFRELSGSIVASQGRLLLTSYDSLTMAAQFDDVTLPLPEEQGQVVQVTPGTYGCRIVQLHDHSYSPENSAALDAAKAHYIVQLSKSDAASAPWQEVPCVTF